VIANKRISERAGIKTQANANTAIFAGGCKDISVNKAQFSCAFLKCGRIGHQYNIFLRKMCI
jgi:hypothetical protein